MAKTYRICASGKKDSVVRIDDLTLSMLPADTNLSALVAMSLLALWQHVGDGRIIVRPGDAAHQMAEQFGTSPAAVVRIATAWAVGRKHSEE